MNSVIKLARLRLMHFPKAISQEHELRCYRDEGDGVSARGPVPSLLGALRRHSGREIHSGREQGQLHSGRLCAERRWIGILVSVAN